jgi:hypothetical protein
MAPKKAAPAKRTIKPKKAGQKPITFQPGGLHKSTGTPAGQPIPAAKMTAAASGSLGPKAAAQSRFAKNVLGAVGKAASAGKGKKASPAKKKG